MKTIPRAALYVAGAIIACADDDEGPSVPASVVRDSAGVTIVENERPRPDSRLGWRVGTAPAITIGTAVGDSAYELFGVTDATRLPDGKIVVANTGSSELRAFDASGVHQGSWGGQGDGPGEFSTAGPSAVEPWPGDSIGTSDAIARRVSVFDANGAHGRTFVLEAPYYRLRGVLPDGKLFLGNGTTLAAGVVGTGVVRRDIAYGIARPDGGLHATLGTHAGSEWYVVSEDERMTVYAQPFARSTLTALWADLIVVSPNDRYEIRAHGGDGTLMRIVRRDHDLRSPTAADVEDHLFREYADASQEERAAALADLRDMPRVETFPAFRRIVGDRLGFLWVEEYLPPDESDGAVPLWTVYDVDGRVRGLVTTPPDLRIFEIGADYILGSTADEFGLEYVQLWTLDRVGT